MPHYKSALTEWEPYQHLWRQLDRFLGKGAVVGGSKLESYAVTMYGLPRRVIQDYFENPDQFDIRNTARDVSRIFKDWESVILDRISKIRQQIKPVLYDLFC